ncbi:G kinase-anchoring protein 1-like isoform X2 [Anthonomus grandis grandis]|uniref:G kinase-anchoring protein 1-like isoform X2 n=1 Tax=Anthonomus grandis grandis TaxID=2921223 RepID=UPI0021652E90|nr:G kinase-anchoring protein 1-like isoform X2 [Anthonomus grandis grandis]
MNIGVPSRFACLKIEDDDFRQGGGSKKKTEGKKSSSASSAKATNKNGTNAVQKKANGVTEKPKSSSKKNKKQKENQDKNWEEWQKKDSKFVNEIYEQQMQSAILQSKLEFENQKKNVIVTEPSQGKKKKSKTMSLDQFLETNKESEQKEESASLKSDRDFFQEVKESVKKTLTKEKVEQNRKKRQEQFEEVISLAQCQEKLEFEREKNAQLMRELEEAKKEITVVKQRNTTLCSMLREGEMKDKAEVLKELERLTLVKEELTEEVANLHKLLEQERSNKPISNSNHVNINQGDAHPLKHNNKEKNKK